MTVKHAQKLIEDTNGETVLGTRTSRFGVEESVSLDDSDRTLHTLITGPTGTGKTNLLLWIALQDIKKGGACFINPKGEAVNKLLAALPDQRLDDAIYINPGRNGCPAINPLAPEAPDELPDSAREKQRKIVVSSLMGLFRRLSKDWGERWPRLLRSLISAHVSQNIYQGKQKTLLDVYHCITDNSKLNTLLEQTEDRITREQLEELKSLNTRERRPILRRLADLLENRTVRNIVTQPRSSISFRDVFENEKILLVDTRSGQIGGWAASIIGSIVFTHLWTATEARETRSQQPPFHIIVDEVQEYVTDADHLRRMLSQCREFNVSLTLATQFLDDLDRDIEQAALNNTLTKIAFAPGASGDLNHYNTSMNRFSKQELGQLGKYRPVVQLPAEKQLPAAVTIDTFPPWNPDIETVEQRKQQLLESQEDANTEPDATTNPVEGGEKHQELLEEAKRYLEFEDQVEVKLLAQDGSSKPDAHIIEDDEVAHLEAEHSTLSKPDRVLKNLERAHQQGRECVFIVEERRLDRLRNILEDAERENYRILTATDLGVI